MGKKFSRELDPNDYPTIPRKFRPAVNVDQETIENADKDFVFQVMSYNVLASNLATKKMHTHATKQQLSFKFRGPRIIKEIAESNADIVALQELNEIDFYEAELNNLGYTLERFPQKYSENSF